MTESVRRGLAIATFICREFVRIQRLLQIVYRPERRVVSVAAAFGRVGFLNLARQPFSQRPISGHRQSTFQLMWGVL